MTTVNEILGLSQNWEFNPETKWDFGSGGSIGWEDAAATRHHVNPTAVANSLDVFKDLAQIAGNDGNALYSHWDFHSNGIRLPFDTDLAQDLGRSSNSSSHIGLRDTLSGPGWFGSLNDRWDTLKSSLDEQLATGTITPELAEQQLRAEAANISSEIRGAQAYLQSRSAVQLDVNGNRIPPIDLQAGSGVDPLGGNTCT